MGYHERNVCCLRGKIPCGAACQTEKPFGIGEEYFNSPAHGVNFISLYEIKRNIGGKQNLPSFVLRSATEEYPYIAATQLHDNYGMMSAVFPAIVNCLSLFKCTENGFCGETVLAISVFCFSHFRHAQQMKFLMATAYEIYQRDTGEPAVLQEIIK